MSLKLRIDKLEDAPEAARSLYVEKDGKFELPIEGVVTKDKLDEFRNNNTKLKTQLDEVNKKFEGIDPEVVRSLLDEHAKIKDKKLLDAGKVDELLAERTAAMVKEHEKTKKALAEELGITKKTLETLLIDNTLQTEAAKAGIRTTALEDVLLRGRQRFKLVDGIVTPMMPDGKVVYGKDGLSTQSMSEWLADLSTAAPHLFEPSSGGGAKPGDRSGDKGSAKTLKRSEYEALDPTSRATRMQEGYTLVD